MLKANVKVGDTIYASNGEPYIIESFDVEHNEKYPFKVKSKIDKTNVLFTNFAKNDYGVYTWFLIKDTKVHTPVIAIVTPNIKRDDYIISVRKDKHYYLHFSHFDEDGNVYAYFNGRDSITSIDGKAGRVYNPIFIDQKTYKPL